jgi:repressor LexA
MSAHLRAHHLEALEPKGLASTCAPDGATEPCDALGSLGAMIRAKRSAFGMTLDACARSAGCSKGYLSQIERGKNAGEISQSILTLLEQTLGFRDGELAELQHWLAMSSAVRARLASRASRAGSSEVGSTSVRVNLLKGNLDELYKSGGLHKLVLEREGLHGSALLGVSRAGESVSSASAIPGFALSDDLVLARVPLINSVAAGAPGSYTDLGYPAGVADDYVACQHVGDPDAFACRIVGQSMCPDYCEGDVVVFSPAAVVEQEMDCFVRFEDQATVTFKRVTFADNMVTLTALNPVFGSKTMPREQIAGIFPAVQVIRKLGKRTKPT